MSSGNVLSSRTLRVAVELTGSGHHPAAIGAAGTRPISGADYWVELTADSVDPLDLTSFPPDVVRIRATDLRGAQQERSRVRAETLAAGRDPDSVTVLVDLEVLIAAEARTARKELALLDSALESPRTPESLQYVGTPVGLAGLIADIQAAGVADGVTLLPLTLPRVLEQLVDGTLPWLEQRGLVTSAEAVDEALRRFDLPRRQRVLAS
ncbi:hypothetical protein CBI38_03525 [Rhodococcus oxybenzonivorans]|uniref:Luciferase-like monooxygenase n=1 Tax=Rhodococcus oxybenzonivorans TaxID=1990687 RepID=A0A2S2BQC3_9NOCA|nr:MULTISPECIES: hypothetical protein [Rhodococcus]AWK70774.1 hypothetical protein CBI38_03525 [Rhodococcus oxybenzonivorans]QTJ66322.1 hypothetical protein HYG77_12370 [Rhodococcus sp. ZPP]